MLLTKLDKVGISCEVIDTQTLVPFDISHDIVESVKNTNRLLVIDEDVPGGASAYIYKKSLKNKMLIIILIQNLKLFLQKNIDLLMERMEIILQNLQLRMFLRKFIQ